MCVQSTVPVTFFQHCFASRVTHLEGAGMAPLGSDFSAELNSSLRALLLVIFGELRLLPAKLVSKSLF